MSFILFQAGYINGTRVVFGQYEQFLKTIIITNLSFLNAIDEGNPDLLKPEVQKYLTQQLGRPVSTLFSLLGDTKAGSKHFSNKRRASMRGAMRLSRSNSTHTG